jgi:arsenite methyltransferase
MLSLCGAGVSAAAAGSLESFIIPPMTNFLAQTFDPKNTIHITELDELPFWSAPFGIVLLNTIRIKKNLKVLDIGSGTGFPLIELAERLGEHSEIYGVDVWSEAVERIQKKIVHRGLTNVTMMNHAAEELPFEDHFFDLVVSNNGLNNVQNPQKVLSEIHRVCKKEAQLVFTVNLPETMKEFYDVYESVLGEFRMQAEIMKMKEHIHEKRKPVEEIRGLLHEAKFKIEREILGEFSYRFPNGTAMFRYYVIREFFLPSWTAIVAESRVLEIFTEIEKRLNSIANQNGELNLTVPFICIDCRCQP